MAIEGPKKTYTPEEAAEKFKQSLKYSIKDGAFSSGMAGFGDFYLPAFVVFLGASALQISLLASFPLLIAAMINLMAVKLTTVARSRKSIVLWFFLGHVSIWLFVIGAFYLVRNVWTFIILAALYSSFREIMTPAWSSWIGDLVPENKRGRFFWLRNRVKGASSFASIVAGGLILQYIADPYVAFPLLFMIAFLSGLISFYYTTKQFEPIVQVREPKKFGFRNFLKRVPTSNFGAFTMYISLMHLSVYLVAPLFTIYWLNTLHFTYLEYMISLSAVAISGFITMTYWGANADHYGNKTILWASSYLIIIIPFLWYFTRYLSHEGSFYLTVVLQAILGFAWAGFDLSTSNFIFDLVKVENRVRVISYFNAIKGTAIFVGSILGGLLAGVTFSGGILLALFPSGFFLVLTISCVLRGIVTVAFLKRIQDIKAPEKKPRFLHFAVIMPVQGIFFDSVVGMNRTIKKFKEQLMKVEKHLDYLEDDYKKKTNND